MSIAVFRDIRPQIGAIKLDASVSEIHSASNKISKEPVGTRLQRTSHVLRNPRTVAIVGEITPHPGTKAFDRPLRGRGREHIKAWKKFLAALRALEPVVVVTTLEEYPPMHMVSIQASRNPTNSGILSITVVLEEVQSAEVEDTFDLPGDIEDMAAPTENLGTLGGGS